MKILVSVFLGLLLFTFTAGDVFAQYRKVTVILLRHAEKNKEEESISLDPNLSAEGEARAKRLVGVIGKYEPQAIYSSVFKRTRATVAPLATYENRRQFIENYDHRNLKQIADLILSGKFKSIVIAGHNSTTPALANLLIGQEKYKALDENEYDKIWIIEIKRNKGKPHEVSEKVIQY